MTSHLARQGGPIDRSRLDPALAAIKNGSMTIKLASDTYHIAYSTLKRYSLRENGAVDKSIVKRVKTEHELKLVDVAKYLAQGGIPINCAWLCEAVGKVVRHKGGSFKQDIASKGWYTRFTKRHPCIPTIMAESRNASVFLTDIDKFFEMTTDLMTALRTKRRPDLTYNMAETTLETVSHLGEVSKFTCTLCVSGYGDLLPPMITVSKDFVISAEMQAQGPDNALYVHSESGLTSPEMYVKYLKHINTSLCDQRPVVIFHYDLFPQEGHEIVDFCFDEQVYLTSFPTSVCTRLQPLNKILPCFKELLNHYLHQIDQEMEISPAELIILQAVKSALGSIKRAEIAEAFQTTGISPFERSAIKEEPEKNPFEKLDNDTLDQSRKTSTATDNSSQKESQEQESVATFYKTTPQVEGKKYTPENQLSLRDDRLRQGMNEGVLDADLVSALLSTEEERKDARRASIKKRKPTATVVKGSAKKKK